MAFELPKFETTTKGLTPQTMDFRFNPGTNQDTGPAQIALQKQELQMKQNQQNTDNILRTVKMASDLAQSFVEASKRRQQRDAIAAYASMQPNKVLAPVMKAFPQITAEQALAANYPKSLQSIAAQEVNRGQMGLKEAATALQKPTVSKLQHVAGKLDGKDAFANYNPEHGIYIDPATGQDISDRFKPNPPGSASTADARLEVSRRNEVDKIAKAVDPIMTRDYDRLTASKRLSQFVESTGGKATRQQVVEASSMLASMLQGGGRGSVVSEQLINRLTPSTLKGTALDKVQWLSNHPQDVDQKEFINLMKTTSDRESRAAEDNIRQQQIQELFKRKGNVKPEDVDNILQTIGLDKENVDLTTGKFIRTPKTRSVLPDFDPYKVQDSEWKTLSNGVRYRIK